MTLATPQPFIIREECHKAAWQHGYRRVLVTSIARLNNPAGRREAP